MPEAREQFLAFREQCVWLRWCYNTFVALFEDEATVKILEKSAVVFFSDLNHILQQYILLQVCNITDPPYTHGKANLTVCFMNDKMKSIGLFTPNMNVQAEKMRRYRSFVVDARNKIISHRDTQTVIENTPLGEHDHHEVMIFFDAMQAYCDEVGWAVGEGPLEFSGGFGRGDVNDLLHILRKALANKVD